ncbi:MAG TPA: TfuA-like protein [Candidatus Methylomirabilis sp.]|nr:TfuA-like protein [Candidatus Methylomirabilis sp.]
MIACVFTGPTLSPAEGRVELDAVYLPPAAQGDLYRAALARPQAIGIIDGYFECVPAVWHKEILWALSQGIHVYGCASMGALRATELAPFGMLGVGRIFEAYRDGVLEDDDEVAVTHGPAETGFRPLSEAMVNIRPTFAAAEAAGVLSPTTRIALGQIAKSLFYPERVYPLILRRAGEEGLPAKELDALRRWLPQGQVNQKRDDALAMLRVMREALGAGLPPKRVTFRLARSAHWEHARVMLSRQARESPDPGSKASGETQARGRGEDGTTHGQAKDAIRVGHPAGRRRSPGESRDSEGSAGGAPSVAKKSAKGRVKTVKKSGKTRRLPAKSSRPRDA